jgi:hypothetical protein
MLRRLMFSTLFAALFSLVLGCSDNIKNNFPTEPVTAIPKANIGGAPRKTGPAAPTGPGAPRAPD